MMKTNFVGNANFTPLNSIVRHDKNLSNEASHCCAKVPNCIKIQLDSSVQAVCIINPKSKS